MRGDSLIVSIIPMERPKKAPKFSHLAASELHSLITVFQSSSTRERGGERERKNDEQLPYSRRFCLVHNFAELPVNPLEEINFALAVTVRVYRIVRIYVDYVHPFKFCYGRLKCERLHHAKISLYTVSLSLSVHSPKVVSSTSERMCSTSVNKITVYYTNMYAPRH